MSDNTEFNDKELLFKSAIFKNFDLFKKIIDRNDSLFPMLLNNMEDVMFFIAFLLDYKDTRYITSIIKHPDFDVCYNRYQYIETICEVEQPSLDFIYLPLVFKSLDIPNIYNNLSDKYIRDKLVQLGNKDYNPDVINAFELIKNKQKISAF